ncbi:MAG: hypothetical protein A2Y08_04300 [Planctomycetes bacterium GWA2_40_7]|nr:MAG: hypothetical protein A2Y08_04300 [Planctomycetes bacterium GWA2_40_7]
MEYDAIIDSYMNREYEIHQIEWIEYGGLQSTHEGRPSVNIRVPKGKNTFRQGIKTKRSPVKELVPGVCVLVAQYTRTVGDNNVIEVRQCKEE